MTVNHPPNEGLFDGVAEEPKPSPLAADVDHEREVREQFKLVRIQLFNWGTFGGLHSVEVSPRGMLFAAPSGAGKSTVFDANAALTTPPRWVNFNVAARESEKRADRNAASYVRGLWGAQTGADGEAVGQFLRKGSTWSAIAQTYENGDGKTVTLCIVLWLKGSTSSARDVQRRYLVADRLLALEELKFFETSDYNVRRFKTDLPDVYATDSFPEYQERFRSRLGIQTEHALKLLHKTQSAKNLGDLSEFLRDFMLDEPKTQELAEDLVLQFSRLDSAHRDVVSAREQIETLVPARTAYQDRESVRNRIGIAEEVTAGIGPFKHLRLGELLRAEMAEKSSFREGARAKLETCLGSKDDAETDLGRLRALRAESGGNQLEQLAKDKERAEAERSDRDQRRGLASQAAQVLDVELPTTPEGFAALTLHARTVLEESQTTGEDAAIRQKSLAVDEHSLVTDLASVQTQVAALTKAPHSNITHGLLGIRERLAADLRIDEEDLPFAGELIEVKQSEGAWQGAIERVLRGFALSMLVEESLYVRVSDWVNDHHLKGRLVYLRMTPQSGQAQRGENRSLVNKVEVAKGPFQSWINSELRLRFNVECVETAAELRQTLNAVTRSGLLKQGGRRHEKNDAHGVDERTNWVLGADTKERGRALLEQLSDINEKLEDVRRQLTELNAGSRKTTARLLAAQRLADLRWSEIDAAGSAVRVAELETQIQGLRNERPDLAELDRQIAEAQTKCSRAIDAHADQVITVRGLDNDVLQLEGRIAGHAALPTVALTPTQEHGIGQRLTRTPTLASLDGDLHAIQLALSEEKGRLNLFDQRFVTQIEAAFSEYNRKWPAESGGLDAKLAAYAEYDAKLTRLQTDGLPEFEKRFRDLLKEQSHQHTSLLSTRLDDEQRNIAERMDAVNRSLRIAEYNPGTYIRIEILDRTPQEARQFRIDIREMLQHSLTAGDGHEEIRFQRLKALIDRLASQQTADVNWRTTVLDVRRHVEFRAKEFDQADVEQEVYESGAGKSGGQRQKLTATCLAAALRYQLGGPGRIHPSFSTVFLDEAFDKADVDFSEAAIKIFKGFNFQLIIATPMKMVMTCEPYVGGAVYVYIKDRKYSHLQTLPYDEDAKRIDWKEAGLPLVDDEVA
jgi:uncharacterized protein YPO0396